MSNPALKVDIGADISNLRNEMQKAQGLMTGFSSQVTGIGKNLSAAFGVTASVGTFVTAARYAVGTMSEFESRMSAVKAISGATGKEFEALRNDALKLGESTKFTAAQVGTLQLEYSRLGFSTREILNSAKATILLATATGEDLGKATIIAGSTLRGFGLDAKEMTRVTDVMAATFNKTASGLESFGESMKYVAPIAKAASVSLEETSAMIGVLADSGIKGSQAGTSLRRIFADLSNDGRPVIERLQELANKGIGLSDAFDEVGRNAQTALLVLANNVGRVRDLDGQLHNVAGSTQQLANIMSDNLEGDWRRFTATIDSWILKGSAFNNVLRGILQSLSKTTPLKEYQNALSAFQHSGTFGDKINFSTKDLDIFNRSMAELKRLALEAGVAMEGQHGPFKPELIAPIVTQTKALRKELTLLQQDLRDTAKTRVDGPNALQVKAGKGSKDISTAPIFPDLQPNIEQLRTLNLTMDQYMDKTRNMQDAVIDLTGVIVSGLTNAFVSLGNAIGQAMAGVDVNFGDVILKTIAGFAQSVGEMLIAAGTTIAVAQTQIVSNPYAAIAAGVALVAIAGAVMGSISSSAANMGGGGGGGNGASARAIDNYFRDREKINATSFPNNINITGLVGNVLTASIRKSAYSTSYTGG